MAQGERDAGPKALKHLRVEADSSRHAMFQRRGVAGVRRLLGDFIRAVHPDLGLDFPEARHYIGPS